MYCLPELTIHGDTKNTPPDPAISGTTGILMQITAAFLKMYICMWLPVCTRHCLCTVIYKLPVRIFMPVKLTLPAARHRCLLNRKSKTSFLSSKWLNWR